MAGQFLIKSRHGSIYYFRRRIPQAAQSIIGKRVLVRSLETSDRRLAVVRSRALATQTDSIFQRIAMAKKTNAADDITFNYDITFNFNELGNPTSISVKADPEEEQAVKATIENTIEAARLRGSAIVAISSTSSQKSFSEAVSVYFNKAQIKPQTKTTYRSKINHALEFFGDSKDVLTIDQADFVGYCDHALATVANVTTQGLYMSTVATFLNWHRVRAANLSPLTTKTLVPKKDSPDSEERDAFTLEQLGLVFGNAKKYQRSNPHKFWVSIAPAFLGCRIEELCQIHLKSDLVNDVEAGTWYLTFDGRPDPDGVMRKSMKKVSSWRRVPIHTAMVRHGFIDFLRSQQQAGFQRPFQREWKPREFTSELGPIIKWSHYISGWGGRELNPSLSHGTTKMN